MILLTPAASYSFGAAKTSKASEAFAPIVVPGKLLKKMTEADEREKKFPEVLAKIKFPSRGVWYLWFKVTPNTNTSSLLSYDLDGIQNLTSKRREIVVQPFLASHWIGWSSSQGYRLEVNVDDPGEHELRVVQLQGSVNLEKVEVTQAPSAYPDGDKLNYSKDTGQGIVIPQIMTTQVDGYDSHWKSPEIVVSGQAYYIDASNGKDAASGESADKAWKTFKNVNGREFSPGDAIFLKRGEEWGQGMAPKGSGTSKKWISIGAYGIGHRPKIDGQGSIGVSLEDQSYWQIQDLDVTNAPEYGFAGIAAHANGGVAQPKGIKILNCVVHETGGSGIYVASSDAPNQGNGFDGVLVENCLSFYNANTGIKVNGNEQTGCRNSVIRHCTTYSNLGGGGIWLKNGQNGLIENCLSYNNERANIFTWNTINITVRNNEAFRCRSGGAGFNIDTCKGCTVEYNYSHHNEGIGFAFVDSAEDSDPLVSKKCRYNILRYSVSAYDNQGISLLNNYQYGMFYNNLVVTGGKEEDLPRAALSLFGWPAAPAEWGWTDFTGGWPSNNEFYNNILIGKDGAVSLWVDDKAATQNNTFDYNLYWNGNPKEAVVNWAGNKTSPRYWEGSVEGIKPPDAFKELGGFSHAANQEKHGIQTDPQFAFENLGAAGRQSLDFYKLQEKSAAMGAGKKVEFSADWVKGRAESLSDTGAVAFGIPMGLDDAGNTTNALKVENGPISIGVYRP